jgi:hypothetical protein
LAQLRSASVAVDAAACGHAPVAVGTGKARIDLQLVNRAAEPVAPVAFLIVVAFAVFPEIRFAHGILFFCCVFKVLTVSSHITPFVIPCKRSATRNPEKVNGFCLR